MKKVDMQDKIYKNSPEIEPIRRKDSSQYEEIYLKSSVRLNNWIMQTLQLPLRDLVH